MNNNHGNKIKASVSKLIVLLLSDINRITKLQLGYGVNDSITVTSEFRPWNHKPMQETT